MRNGEIKANASRPDAEEMIEMDRPKLAQIGRMIVGNKSIQMFCEERDISRSLVSKLLNQALVTPPTIRSINKFVGGGNEHLLNDMLEACGYPPVTHDLLEKLKDQATPSAGEQVDSLDRADWSPTAGLQLVLDKLLEREYRDCFQVDFRSNGLFAIKTGSGDYKMVGIPAFCSSNQDSDSVYEHTLIQFGRALSIWNPTKSFYCILTNSIKLAKEFEAIPNVEFNLAVLLTTDRHNFSGRRVTAHMGDNKKMDDSILEYLVDLKTSVSD